MRPGTAYRDSGYATANSRGGTGLPPDKTGTMFIPGRVGVANFELYNKYPNSEYFGFTEEDTMDQIKHKDLLLRTIGLILIWVFLLACGMSGLMPSPQTPTPIIVPASPTIIPTQTPSLIPGIDEPVTLEERGIKFLILGADFEAGQEAGHTKLILKYGPPFNLSDAEWIANNSQVTCGATTYPTRSMGFFVGDAGKIEYFRLIFHVPDDINLPECRLQVTGVMEIPLASLAGQ